MNSHYLVFISYPMSLNTKPTQKYAHMSTSDTVLSCSQKQEISWMKLIMALSITAHVPHIRTCTRRTASQEVTLILQKHTQMQPNTSTHAQADALTGMHTHIQAQYSLMFALRGQEITCVCRLLGNRKTHQVHTR